jgi:cobalt-zinc-cadmium efflux system membrane fusion protein
MKNSRMFRLTLGVLVILTGCHSPTDAPEEKAGVTEEAAAPTDHVTIAPEIAKASGIRVAPAGSGTIQDEHTVQGLLTPIEGRAARVVARFPGPVRAVQVNVGDTVRAGQSLATIESNISLSNYTVSAPLGGTVMARHVAVGDLAGDAPLFEIADLSRLWVDMHIFGADAQHLRAGIPVSVTRMSDDATITTTVDRLLPGMATASQSTVARAVIANTDGNWRPGTAVQARISVSSDAVDLAVPLAAVQTLRGQSVVFVQHADTYQVRPVSVGRRDSTHAEITEGLKPGEPVVVAESYLIKADLEKASVEDAD